MAQNKLSATEDRVISALALSLKGILAKYIFAEGVDVATLLAIRYSLTLPMLVGIALMLKGSWCAASRFLQMRCCALEPKLQPSLRRALLSFLVQQANEP